MDSLVEPWESLQLSGESVELQNRADGPVSCDVEKELTKSGNTTRLWSEQGRYLGPSLGILAVLDSVSMMSGRDFGRGRE